MLSIKLLNIAIVLFSIVLTGFLCTYLVVLSSDDALDKTKKLRDDSVDNAFDVGTEGVQNITKALLNQVSGSATNMILSFIDPHTVASSMLAGMFLAENSSVTHQYNFFGNLNPVVWNLFNGLNHKGMTGLGFALDNYGSLLIYEDENTVQRPPEDYHYSGVVWNTGLNSGASVQGGLARSMQSDTIPYTGRPLGVPYDTDINVNWDSSTCRKSAIPTNGSIPDEPCVSELEDTKGLFYPLGALVESGEVAWTTPFPAQHFLILACVGSFRHQDHPTYQMGLHSGMSYAMIDLRHISYLLRSFNISEHSRVYTTVRANWVPPHGTGLVTGASRGRTHYYNNGIKAIYPIESDDWVIKGTGEYLAEAGYDNVMQSTNLTEFNMTSDRAPEGEIFYVKVAPIENKEKINWHVTITIDRKHILGQIDANLLATQRAISETEKDVQDTLDSDRLRLYLLVAGVTLVLVVLSTVFVFGIISPLETLQHEMALVAIMRLECVESTRPFSALSEVRLMQASFLQMLKNLKEYRNFIPASALQDETEDESNSEDGTSKVSSGGRSVSNTITVSQGNTSHQLSLTKTALHNDVRTKKITLLSCNVIGFLDGDAVKKVNIHAKYLTACLACAKETKGIPDSFSGDRIYLSWNAAKQCNGHRSNAVMFATEMLKHLKQHKITVSMAICSSDTSCGNMGIEMMKKYNYIGSLPSWLHVLQHAGSLNDARICIDGSIKDDAEAVFFIRTLDLMLFIKHSKLPMLIYEVKDEKQVTAEEWMYQLQGTDRLDKYKNFNVAWVLYSRGDGAGAKAALHASELERDAGFEVLSSKIEALLRDGETRPVASTTLLLERPFLSVA
eukprot:TRINITY_DN34439_c0_g1_i1.p1 TRINITY_DN34439_c0_g1~~TRINITY_DN34439_c0_g1_i1.p1  ORF type:complete len:860 (+),score=100.08 TRINITY_DN34439_c0_g1_i1:43-2580(+)